MSSRRSRSAFWSRFVPSCGITRVRRSSARRSPAHRWAVGAVESLEARTLLSGDGLLAAGLLNATSSGGDATSIGATGSEATPLNYEIRMPDGSSEGAINGHEYHASIRYQPPTPVAGAAAAGRAEVPPFPLADTFNLHSLPGADFVLYLDFDGHTTTGTPWNTNGRPATFTSRPYSEDADPNFSDAEKETIQQVFLRVAEDYAPFNIDVTTEEPPLEDLRKVGANDTKWGIRTVITPDDLPARGAGGVAFLGSFQFDTDTPAFVFNPTEIGVAEAVSHEVGHSLGLSHDGRFSPPEEYYFGHGQGPTGWAPIMGAGYITGLTQFSQGEYPSANNQEDDLAIITDPALNGATYGYSGLSYKTDEAGDTDATATPLTVTGGNQLSASGIITTRIDVDVYSFDTSGGSVTLNVSSAPRGPNLDILAQLYDSNGQLVAQDNPADDTSASITATLAAGRYFLRIDGVGKAANGTDFGYSDYGSIGQYTVTGNATVGQNVVNLSVSPKEINEDANGVLDFNFTRGGSTASPLTVTFIVNGNADLDTDFTVTGTTSFVRLDNFDGLYRGTVVFAAGQSSLNVLIDPIADNVVEFDEDVVFNIEASSNYRFGPTTLLVGTILNDDNGNTDDDYEENDTRAAAADPLGNGGRWAGTALSNIRGTGISRDDDWYRIQVDGPNLDLVTDLTFKDANGNLGLEVVDSTGAIVASSNTTNDNEHIETTLAAPGTYFLHVFPSGPVTGNRYDLVYNVQLPDDVYEENDTLDRATDPLGNGGRWANRALSTIRGRGVANDADWYSVRVLPGQEHLIIDATFAQARGDIDMRLVDEFGRLVTVSSSDSDNERIDVQLTTPGQYYIVVFPFRGVGNTYDLVYRTIATPGVSVTQEQSQTARAEDGNGRLIYTFTRTGDLSKVLTANFSVGGTAQLNQDYTQSGASFFSARSGRVRFEAGRATTRVIIDPTADDIVEANETVILTVTGGPGYAIARDFVAIGTIINDDIARAYVSNASIVEGNDGTSDIVFTVRIDTKIDAGISIGYVTQGDTATMGQDFVAKAGRAVIAAGQRFTTVRVRVKGDGLVERNEIFRMKLLTNFGGPVRDVRMGRQMGTGLIRNDDVGHISVRNALVTEGNERDERLLTFTVTLDRAVDTGIFVRYRTQDRTATAGSDYTATAGRLQFRSGGERQQTVQVRVHGDVTVERDELLNVVLQNFVTFGRSVIAGRGTATGAIFNDDSARLSISDASETEGGPGGVRFLRFNVSLDQPVDAAVQVNYATRNMTATGGTAASGADYGARSGRIVFGPGVTSRTLQIPIYGDNVAEPNETLRVLLSDLVTRGRAVTLQRNSAIGVIRNDDGSAAAAAPALDSLFASGLADSLL